MNVSVSRAVGAVFPLALALFAGGCDSISMPQFGLPDMKYAQTKSYPEDEVTVYAAAQTALDSMNYTLVRGSRATGKFEMASRVLPGSALNVRQRRAVVEVGPGESGDTDLKITFWEATEDESAGGTVTATNRILREESLYQAFWERLAEKLADAAAAQATPAPAPSATP